MGITMLRSEAIKNLLRARTHADLANLYSKNMEVQVNVAQDNGDRVDTEYKGRRFQSYTDGIETWKHFRIPQDAKTDPTDNDAPLYYDLATHTEGIGMTGWDWVHKVSRWVAFDFDAVTGHSEKHTKKLTEAALRHIREAVSSIPWVTIRLSTSGKGLHLYVFLAGKVSSTTHTEHAAIARSIIGLMSSLTGVDLQSSVDQCGGNMWVWHRKMLNTDGLKIIKQGSQLADIPANWRDHLSVINNRTRKVLPAFIQQSGNTDLEKIFDELTSSKTQVPLDEEHQKLIKFLHELGAQSWWDHDNHLLVTHTIYLKEAHDKLNLRGPFSTIAQGTDKGGDWNCFCFPLRRGAWAVRRYTPGVAESPTWDQDTSGFTRCHLNREPDLPTASRSLGGIEHPSGGFIFREAEVAVKVLQQLGSAIDLPSWTNTRRTKIKEHKDGRLVVEIKQEPDDPALTGWIPEKGTWKRIFNTSNNQQTEPEIGNYDDSVRHLITENNQDCGWSLKSEREWREEPLIHVRTFLKAMNLNASEVDGVLGSCISRPWKLVCLPFEPEEPGDRQWNRNSPQLAFVPTASDTLSYPTWVKMLSHIGSSLDEPINRHPWCKENGILSGFDYLKCWIASLFKEPHEPLPYLFLYSKEQNTGKSSLQEGISMLVTKGVVRADNALINPQGFNGELENAIVCVVEEIDMQHNKTAYGRIKDFVTSRQMPIHRKTCTPYSVANTSHWIQTANDYKACPIFEGDSRITMIEVPSLGETKMPRKEWEMRLQKEAPDFLAAILNLELPISDDRLNLPIVETQIKKFAIKANQTYLELFIEDFCFQVDGETIKYSEFYDRFVEWLDVDQLRHWSKIRVGRELPEQFPKGRSTKDNQVLIGNISWTARKPESNIQPKLALIDGKLVVVLGKQNAKTDCD